MARRFFPARPVVAILTVGFCLLLLVATPASAARGYSDADSNPLKLIYFAVYPVAKAVEWMVFRPLHLATSRLIPDPSDRAEGRRACTLSGRRPLRSCTPPGKR